VIVMTYEQGRNQGRG